jgi:hypothetical protein
MSDHATRSRAHASRRGISLIWVALSCGAAFSSTLFALYYWTEWKDTEVELARQQMIGEQLQMEHQEQLTKIDKILPYTGLKKAGEAGEPPIAEAKAFLKSRQDEWRPAFLKLQDKNKQLSMATVEGCAEVAGMALESAVADRDRAKQEHARRKAAVEIAQKRKGPIDETKQRSVEEIQKKIAAVVEERTKAEAAFSPKAQKIEEQTSKETQERETAEQKHKAEMLRLENEINELKRRLEEFKQREVIRYDITEIHGEIIEHDVEGKFAFINIGSNQRVVNGLRFHCALPGEFGALLYKGEVEVKKVWPTRSQVAITNVVDPTRPILRGDVLVNPLFGSRRPKVVAFAGEPVSRRIRLSVNEATRRILEIQSTVKPETTVDLDFLIVTDAFEGDKNYLKAVELQIPIAPANEVLKYLGR